MEEKLSMREVQLIQIKMLKELDRLCKKHRITYFLGGGTLLGAVRHQAFIPWDDDIDVILLRKEYDRLMRVLSEELDPQYFLQTFYTDKGYRFMFGKIRCNNTLFVEQVTRNENIHQGIFIDIFPLDNIPDSKFARILHKYVLIFLDIFRLSASLDMCRSSSSPIRRTVGYAMYPIAKILAHRPYLRLIEKVAKIYQNKETKYISDLYGNTIRWYEHPKQAHPKWIYEKVEYRQFEGMTLPVPSGWHEYLCAAFGDYMRPLPPEERKPAHDVIRIELDTRGRKDKGQTTQEKKYWRSIPTEASPR